MTDSKDLKTFFKSNGFNLSVRRCKGTMKQYFIVGGRKKDGIFPSINTKKLNDFLNKHFLGFDRKPFELMFSYNGGLSTLIHIGSVKV